MTTSSSKCSGTFSSGRVYSINTTTISSALGLGQLYFNISSTMKNVSKYNKLKSNLPDAVANEKINEA
ncbi:hypothetical protein JCM33374_g5147 [Metschnikowia sp. JCM 33374]|nr:hypothetical protein JCM33374_g5147 [Metschnikowia sp. JCM 33374]